MKKIVMYTDGGARGNPGPSGIGAVILDADGTVLKEVSKYIGRQTNNFAEYEAVIEGLKTLKKLFGKQAYQLDIEVRLDSQLIAEQLSHRYQINEPTLFPQFIAVHNMRIKDFPNVTFRHVPREKNKEADRLVNEAIDKEQKGLPL